MHNTLALCGVFMLKTGNTECHRWVSVQLKKAAVLPLPFLLQIINCMANNEIIPLASLLHATFCQSPGARIRSGAVPRTAPTPMGPGQKIAFFFRIFSRARSALIKRTIRCRCRLAKEGQSHIRNVPALKPTVPARKDFTDLPLLRANPSLHRTQTTTRTPLP